MHLASFIAAFALAIIHYSFSYQRTLDLFLILLSAWLIFAARVYSRTRVKQNTSSWLLTASIAVLFASFWLLNAAYFAASVFTGQGITQHALDHFNPNSLQAGLQGWVTYYWGLILLPILFIAAWLLLPILTRANSPKKRATIFFVTVFAMILHPATYDLAKATWYAKLNQGVDPILMEQLRSGAISDSQIAKTNAKLKGKKRKNALVIYLEGYERAALNPDRYPLLAPNLRRLEQQSGRYGSFIQANGANHTIAGLVSSQCGIPYATTGGSGNLASHGGGDYYMPHVQCLADVTKKLGYRNIYYQGGLLDFTRKGAFFSSHGYDEVNGINEPWTDIPEENRLAWGFHDDLLFSLAQEKIDQLMQDDSDQPFMLTMLTLDTHDHYSTNRMSQSCYERGIANYPGERHEHKIQDQLYCSDILVSEFVNKVLEKYPDEINIYLVSDHLPHAISTMLGAYSFETRELIFIALNGVQNEGERILTHLDIGATILHDLTEGQLSGLGMGVALQSEPLTLIEQLGTETLNTKIDQNHSALADVYWRYPSLHKQTINVDVANREVKIGEASFPMPVAFQINREQEIESYYSFDIDRYIKTTNATDGIVYVDRCAVLANYQSNDFSDDEYCLLAGNLGAQTLYLDSINDNTDFSSNVFADFFDKPSNPERYRQRVFERASNTQQRVVATASSSIKPLAEVAFTAGAEADGLMVTNYWNLSLFEKFRGFRNHFAADKPGLYLFGIKAGRVELLHQWSRCDQDSMDALSILNASEGTEFVAVTGTKLGSCINSSAIFENTPFAADLSSLDEHQHYVGYWRKDSNHYRAVFNREGESAELRLIDQDIFESLPF